MPELLPGGACTARRLRSTHHEPDGPLPEGLDTVVGPTDAARDLRGRLVRREGLALVGGTPEQVHKLLEPGGPDAPRRLFALILIDEASQMDVAHAILPLRGLAEGGAAADPGMARRTALAARGRLAGSSRGGLDHRHGRGRTASRIASSHLSAKTSRRGVADPTVAAPAARVGARPRPRA
jgi:hypothetical protein